MKAPVCKICGAAHWAYQGHVFKRVVESGLERSENRSGVGAGWVGTTAIAAGESDPPGDIGPAISEEEGAQPDIAGGAGDSGGEFEIDESSAAGSGGGFDSLKARFDKRAYQREYMRKRRGHE